ALVARGGIASRDHEGVEVAALARIGRLRGAMIVVAQHSALAPLFRRQGTRGENRAGRRLAGGFAGADLRPGFEIVDGVEDAAADLAIGRAGSVGPVLLKGADGNAEEAGGFLRAQESWRQACQGVGHGITSGSSLMRAAF